MNENGSGGGGGSGGSSSWRSKQIWIKDVLSKSGTELMEITSQSAATEQKHGPARKAIKRTDAKELPDKMVYYPSTPLILKTEQPAQAQFCAQLRSPDNTSLASASPVAQSQPQPQPQQQHAHLYQAQQAPLQNFSIQNGQVVMQTHPHSPTANTATPATANGSAQLAQLQSNVSASFHFLTSIKSELLPPNISLYTTASTATPQTAGARSAASAAGIGGTAGGRKTANASKPQFKCEQCGMTFGSKSAHTSHTKSHMKSGEANASAGGRERNSGPTSGSLSLEAIEVNEAGVPVGIPKTPQIKPIANAAAAGADPYQCNVCQKTFAVPARLIRHYRTHTGERPFECEFCHKLFSVKENLQVHRRIHTKERPYKCNVCGRAFEHSGKLHRHMRIHTGERPHKCSVCEKTFIQSGQLVIHMRTHTGEKPYKCPVENCGKGFTCSKQLKVHSRTHTGEKPYHCDICFRDFGYNHVLKLHRVQHYGSKCYKCTICDETFKSKKEMEAHIKGHANELPDEDDEAAALGSTGPISSASSGSGGESAPASPQMATASTSAKVPPAMPAIAANATKSPTAGAATKTKKPRQSRARASTAVAATALPPSPSSPTSSRSSSSSMASTSRLSAGSPVASEPSPATRLKLESDQHSHDSGVASKSSSVAATPQIAYKPTEELPTDLSVQPVASLYKPMAPQGEQQSHTHESNSFYDRQSQSPNLQSNYGYVPQSTTMERPTINPALLEAASIRRAMLEPHEEEETQAALQIMQLRRSQTHSKGNDAQFEQPPEQSEELSTTTPAGAGTGAGAGATAGPLFLGGHDLAHYDDTHEANELIERYKRGELAPHGLQKGYAPVPKYEPSNNDILLQQVEAAIAPLRSSTESPDRSSSPESDSMMMADRDIMTLPLRKRKLYMSEGPNEVVTHEHNRNHNHHHHHHHHVSNSSNNSGTGVTVGAGGSTKVMRMSSVIQYAKAS